MCANEYHLTTPLQEVAVKRLKLGDTVYLNGEIVITAGLPTHQRMMQYIEKGQALPTNLVFCP